MDVTIIPNKLQGTVTPPSSKSVGHRALIAAALSGGFSTISNLGDSKDIQATRSCLSALKTGQPAGENGLPLMDCGESGSTLRFLIPLSLVLRGGGHFTGRGRLMERPQGPYFSLFQEKGIFYQQKDSVLTVRGTLSPGRYSLPGDVSSQFITGLLFVLPLLDGDSDLVLTSPLESRGYVDLTLDVLRTFGIRVEERADAFHVPGSQHYESRDFTVEADWSQAAFWYAANFAGGQVDIQGLNMDSKQGDKVIALQYWQLAKPGEAELDVSQCPDLVPPLAAMAALRDRETTRIGNAARLRIKESDRLSTVTEVLSALGADIEEQADALVIRGKEKLPGGVTVSGHNDHRIAMMAAIAATRCEKPVTITGAECVKKSYPRFWEDYEKLGGQLTRA